MVKPSLFIGSSSEGLEFARAVRTSLTDDAEITLWNEGSSGWATPFIETLVTALPRFDFALLVLTPDDLLESRAAEMFSPRDNVLFELGLFMGRWVAPGPSSCTSAVPRQRSRPISPESQPRLTSGPVRT
jgi:predicted nucleotide-binding protein